MNDAEIQQLIDKIDFFNKEKINQYIAQNQNYLDLLARAKNKEGVIDDSGMVEYLKKSKEEIETQRDALREHAANILAQTNLSGDARQRMTDNVVALLTSRLNQRLESYNELESEVKRVKGDFDTDHEITTEDLVNYAIIGGIVLIILILFIVAISRKRKNKRVKTTQSLAENAVSTEEAREAIVVRRRTTSILKKQSLDDVIDNPSYLKIDTAEFAQGSAVRRIYIKNTCIKEVYNMYAEDLRNVDNPNEDGCMVLGRWVYNPDSQTYDISMETVVMPGDDAVFKEYELNFGGKIKLKVAEKLRKLRKDSNLQYDLTCWIHSHPGLGVFFSNSDTSVQMQLKHAQHPNFLVAFVVDILTANQELGIFTFKNDGNMLSKSDLIKMYSLEEMYKWALESARNDYSPENYYNILASAELKNPACQSVNLNNNAIIDLTQLALEPVDGLAGWAVGFVNDTPQGKEYAVSSIAKTTEKPGSGIIGCFMSVAHLSLPTLQRLIARENSNIGFAIVYSKKSETVTTIPVVNGEVIADEKYHGDVTIEDLKIWTRRKR